MPTLTLIYIILIIILLVIISALPLYISVNLLGGEATILRVLLTNSVVAILLSLLVKRLGSGSIILVLLTIIAYKFIFKLNLLKAFFAWILQYIVIGVLAIIVFFTLILLGIGLII
jgi:hypothetical protein